MQGNSERERQIYIQFEINVMSKCKNEQSYNNNVV